MRDFARSFYQSRQWKETQAAYMSSRHYICERCGEVARVVHHKKYITPQNIGDMDITLNWDNLESLCMDCHNQEHTIMAPTSEGLTFDANGNLIRR